MKKIVVYLLSIMALFFVVSCRDSSNLKKDGKEKFIRVVKETPLFVGQKTPTWIYKTPDKVKKGYLWFVGYSSIFADEKNAVADAMNSAIKAVAKYIGTDVRSSIKTMQTSLGKSSTVFDPLIAKKQVDEFLVQAAARKVKKKETYSVSQKQLFLKNGNKIYKYGVYSRVLVYVPKIEMDKEIAHRYKYQKELKEQTRSSFILIDKAEAFLKQAEIYKKVAPEKGIILLRKAENNIRKSIAMVRPYPEINKISFKKILNPLQRNISILNKYFSSNADVLLKLAVKKLVASQSRRFRIAISSVTYADSGLPTEFSRQFSYKLEELLSSNKKQYDVIAQKDLQRKMTKRKISAEDILKNGFMRLKGLIFVTYFEKGDDKLDVKIMLKEVRTLKLIKTVSIVLPRSMFSCYEFIPNRREIRVRKFLQPRKPEKGFKVNIWPAKGKASFFKKGEFVSFYGRATRNCYIYIYNYTKDGTLYLVHPWKNASNYVRANKIFTFPDSKKSKIKVQAPFGREQIKVIASLTPIKSLNKKWKFIDITELENYAPYRSLKALHLAEAVCSLMTVEK